MNIPMTLLSSSPLWMRTQAHNDVPTALKYLKDTGLEGNYQALPSSERYIAEQAFTSYLVFTPNYHDSRKNYSNQRQGRLKTLAQARGPGHQEHPIILLETQADDSFSVLSQPAPERVRTCYATSGHHDIALGQGDQGR